MITTNSQLNDFLSLIAKEEVLAIDTEFLRVDTFYPNPCVLQVASKEHHNAIDVLAEIDLSLVKDALYGKTLVFHSARQDLEVFYHLFGALPPVVFDTQILAHFLGFARQISYGNLVFELLGVTLEKAYSHYDWSTRPLPKEVLQYALEDVIYLIQIYHKCKHVSLYNYAYADAQLLLDPALYSLKPEHSHHYLKGKGRLSEEALNIATRICAYREIQASEQNIPRKWVLSDEKILAMATNNAVPKDIWMQLPEVPHVSSGGYTPPTPEERNIIKQLQKQFEFAATAYNLPPELFATKKDMLSYLRGNTSVVFCTGWRRDILDSLQIEICTH